MTQPFYYDEFNSYSDLPYGNDNPLEESIIYAGYTYEDYSGSALIVFTRNGTLYENNDGHCSCFGLEDWSPEETTKDALLIRGGWPGLHDAVKAALP